MVDLTKTALRRLRDRLGTIGETPRSIVNSSALKTSVVNKVSGGSKKSLMGENPTCARLTLFTRVGARNRLILIGRLSVKLKSAPRRVLAELRGNSFSGEGLPSDNGVTSSGRCVTEMGSVSTDAPDHFGTSGHQLCRTDNYTNGLTMFTMHLSACPATAGRGTFCVNDGDIDRLTRLEERVLSAFGGAPRINRCVRHSVFSMSTGCNGSAFLDVGRLNASTLPELFSVGNTVSTGFRG